MSKYELLQEREGRPLTPALRQAQDEYNAALKAATTAIRNLGKARAKLVAMIETENLKKLEG